MVLGILTSIAACPAIIGTTEAVRQGQAQNAREKHRGTKTNLTARCTKKSSLSSQIDGGLLVLRNHKVRLFLSHFACQLSKTSISDTDISLSSSSCTSPPLKTTPLRTKKKKTSSNSNLQKLQKHQKHPNLHHRPPTPSQATSSRTPRTPGAGVVKASSAPLAPGPQF